MSIIFDGENFIDERTENSIFNSDSISVSYTLYNDDVRQFKRVSATHYESRQDSLIYQNGFFTGASTDSVLEISPFLDGLRFDLKSDSSLLSEYGINLPFNFMGKVNGGGWEKQYLFNSPYTSPCGKIIYAYLENPSGNSLLVACLKGVKAWKMDYSPYLWAHYFVNLKLLSSFDKVYGDEKGDFCLSFVVLPVSNMENALLRLSEIYDLPFLSYNVSGGRLGEKITLLAYGRVDGLICEYDGAYEHLPYDGSYTLKNQGKTTIYPVSNGKKGAGVSVFAYDDLISLYKKSMDSVNLDIVKKYTDGNLCEHQCWASAMLRFLLKHKSRLTKKEIKEYEDKVLSLLNIITEENESLATPHITILKSPHEGLPAYNVYRSRRVQELFFGITILLDAYKYFHNEKYYEYLIGACDNLVCNYQNEEGAIFVDWGNNIEDYSSVCSPMIPLLDVANYIKSRDKCRYLRYFESAWGLARHLYTRGLHFPTEGGKTDLAEEEMEDGSISCTALSLLYYCKNAERNEEYVKKAKEILDLHSSWVIKTPMCEMFGSSLRWWETQWEGDKDGPALCCGHAWSIWRGEADYLYYELTGDESHYERAVSTFITNLSKIQKNGTSFAIYSPDLLTGGGFGKINYRIAPRYPDTPDSGLSRYVWIRINNTFLS